MIGRSARGPAAVLVLVLALGGCALTREERQGLQTVQGRIVALATDARRNLDARMSLARLLADKVIDAQLAAVASAQQGMVSLDFARAVTRIRIQIMLGLRAIEAAELANIRGNATQGQRVLEEILAANAKRAELERSDWKVIQDAIKAGMEAYRKSKTSRGGNP